MAARMSRPEPSANSFFHKAMGSPAEAVATIGFNSFDSNTGCMFSISPLCAAVAILSSMRLTGSGSALTS